MNELEGDGMAFGPFRNFFDSAARDFYVAGLIESGEDGVMGELFSTIIVEQFLRLRDSDPEWFENINHKFDEDQNRNQFIRRNISQLTFADIITAITEIEQFEIQSNLFVTTGANCRWENRTDFVQPRVEN